jgi:hypothetical protein
MSDHVSEHELPVEASEQTQGGSIWLPALLGVLCTLCVLGLIVGLALVKSGAF